MGIGMLIFGIPIGIAISISLGNFAFIGAGIAIGTALGAAMQENARKKGQIIELTKKEKSKRKKLGWIMFIAGIILLVIVASTFLLK